MLRGLPLRGLTRTPLIAHRSRHLGSYKLSDATVETDDIITENNPWSPTLYTDVVRYKPRGRWLRTQALPDNYRLSYQSLYEAPGSKYVSLLRRLTISFAVLGAYGAKLFYELVQFDDIYALFTLVGTISPAAFVQYKTKDYVTRIFRLYDKDKPQTLDNLVSDERLVMEKLLPMGLRTYNEVLQVSDNTLLQLQKPLHGWLVPLATWKEVDPETNRKRAYYVVDNIGGIKMDRLWGVVEHNLGVNHGRYIDPATNERLPEDKL